MQKILSLVLIVVAVQQSQGAITDGLFGSLQPVGNVVNNVGQLVVKPVNGLLNKTVTEAMDKLLGAVDEKLEEALCQVITKVLVPTVDCTDPFKGLGLLSNQVPNCMSDCICIHGFNSGYCAKSTIIEGGTACLCSMDMPTTDVQAFEQFRTDACAKNQVVQATLNTLCSLDTFDQAFHPACNADCRCGHEQAKGICTKNGDVTTDNRGLCQCKNE